MSDEDIIRKEDNNEKYDDDNTKYNALIDYSEQMERVCNRIISIGKIVFVSFPVVLLTVQRLADLDKTSVLLIWIVGMFILAICLILVGFFDHTLKERLKEVYGDEQSHSSKLKMLQGRAMVKTIISEIGKPKEERSIDDFAEEFTKFASDNEDNFYDRIIEGLTSNIETEDVNDKSESIMELNDILREFNEEKD